MLREDEGDQQEQEGIIEKMYGNAAVKSIVLYEHTHKINKD